MVPGGFTDSRILQAIDDQFEKMHLANFQQVCRDQPIFKVTYRNELIFDILMQYQSRTKVKVDLRSSNYHSIKINLFRCDPDKISTEFPEKGRFATVLTGVKPFKAFRILPKRVI